MMERSAFLVAGILVAVSGAGIASAFALHVIGGPYPTCQGTPVGNGSTGTLCVGSTLYHYITLSTPPGNASVTMPTMPASVSFRGVDFHYWYYSRGTTVGDTIEVNATEANGNFSAVFLSTACVVPCRQTTVPPSLSSDGKWGVRWDPQDYNLIQLFAR